MLKMRGMDALLAHIRQSVFVAIVLALASAADSVEHHHLIASLLWTRDQAVLVVVEVGQNIRHCLSSPQP